MNHGRSIGLALLVPAIVALGACGSTSVDGGTSTAGTTTATGAGGGTQTTTTGAGGATTTTTGAGGATTTTTTTSGTTTPCGELTCAPGEACVVVEKPTACSDAPEDGGACPDGTTLTECAGGAGTWPCCCWPTPPFDYRCEPAAACADGPTCECVATDCPEGMMCQAFGGEPVTLHCVEPMPA